MGGGEDKDERLSPSFLSKKILNFRRRISHPHDKENNKGKLRSLQVRSLRLPPIYRRRGHRFSSSPLPIYPEIYSFILLFFCCSSLPRFWVVFLLALEILWEPDLPELLVSGLDSWIA